MEKAAAGRMLEVVISMGNEINKLDSIVSDLDGGREREELVQALVT